jgi:hypothetical protein
MPLLEICYPFKIILTVLMVSCTFAFYQVRISHGLGLYTFVTYLLTFPRIYFHVYVWL